MLPPLNHLKFKGNNWLPWLLGSPWIAAAMAARPPLLACLAVAGVVRNPKLRWTVGFRFGPGPAVCLGFLWKKKTTGYLMEIVGGIDINNNTCWHIGEGTCFDGIFNCSTGLESGVLKGEGACKFFLLCWYKCSCCVLCLFHHPQVWQARFETLHHTDPYCIL